MSDKLTDAIELIRIGAGAKGYRSYPGTGGMGVGGNDGIADATFEDWGLARGWSRNASDSRAGQATRR